MTRTLATFLAATALVAAFAAEADGQLADVAAPNALAATISRLLEDAIPVEYDKQKDWGATTDIPAGWRVTGKPFHYHVNQRHHAVKHGVWKHYTLRIIDPEQNLQVTLANLTSVGPGRIAFTLDVDVKIDAWARMKVYEYGVHLGAVEMEADMRAHVVVEGELGVELHTTVEGLALIITPVVAASRLEVNDFHLRRVSDAKGPIVQELGDGVRRLVEDELNGPRLTDKINRAIEKKRDRLTFRPSELLESTWWPLGRASVAPVESPAP